MLFIAASATINSSDVDALVSEIMAREPLVTRSKSGQVKGLVESRWTTVLHNVLNICNS